MSLHTNFDDDSQFVAAGGVRTKLYTATRVLLFLVFQRLFLRLR